MGLEIDVDRGKEVIGVLYDRFTTSGVFGNIMPRAGELPKGVERGSDEHVMFVTLTVSIDFQRDAEKLWESSKKTYEDPETHYLFEPESLFNTPEEKILEDMKKYGLSHRHNIDAGIWRTLGVTFYKKWGSNPLKFVHSCDWDAQIILERVKKGGHLYDGKEVPDYPYLRGDKIAPLWLRMLKDSVGVALLQNLDKIPIPVDIHVARATLATGVVRGQFHGRMSDLFQFVRGAWFESVKGLEIGKRSMIPLDVEEPLMFLSRGGCSKRDSKTGDCPQIGECVVRDFHIDGVVSVDHSKVILRT